MNCKSCGTGKIARYSKYCSILCQHEYQYKKYIEKWKAGKVPGTRGKNTFNFSNYVVRYIQEKYDSKCVKCGWCEINTLTRKIPLEINHVDGNSENNTEQNLELLCPNCHSLTHNYKNLNKGNGRNWRKIRYNSV